MDGITGRLCDGGGGRGGGTSLHEDSPRVSGVPEDGPLPRSLSSLWLASLCFRRGQKVFQEIQHCPCPTPS